MNICNYCNIEIIDDNYIKLNKYSIYPNSEYIYCLKCWDDRDNILKCQKCYYFYQGYKCSKDNLLIINNDMTVDDEYSNICNYCKCDGINCNYCPKHTYYDVIYRRIYIIYNIIIEKKNNYLKEKFFNILKKKNNNTNNTNIYIYNFNTYNNYKYIIKYIYNYYKTV